MPTLKEMILQTLRATKAPNIDAMLKYMEAHGYYDCKCHTHNHWEGGSAEHMWATYLMAKALRDQRISDPNVRKYATDEKLAIVCLLHDLCDMDVHVKTNKGKDVSNEHGTKSYWIMRNLNVGTLAEREAVKNHMHRAATCSLRDANLIAEYNVLHSLLATVDHWASGTAWNLKRHKEGRTQISEKISSPRYPRATALDRTFQSEKYKMYLDKDYSLQEFKNYDRNKIVWGFSKNIRGYANRISALRLPLDTNTDIITSLHNYLKENNERICLVMGCKDRIPKDDSTRLRQDRPLEQNVLICSNILASLYKGEKDESTEMHKRRFRMKFTMRDEIKNQYKAGNLKEGVFFPDVTMIRSGESDGFPFVSQWTIDILMVPDANLIPFAILSEQIMEEKLPNFQVKEHNMNIEQSMYRVFRIDNQWVFFEDGYPFEESNNSQVFDSFQSIAITDSMHARMCVLGHNGKYGIYTLDDCYGYGGSGKYFNPTKDAFPYDEILLSRMKHGICYAACRIGNKWGIEKIVDGGYLCTNEVFTNTYSATKRRTVVPCKFDSLEAAQSQIISWHDFRERPNSFVWCE